MLDVRTSHEPTRKKGKDGLTKSACENNRFFVTACDVLAMRIEECISLAGDSACAHLTHILAVGGWTMRISEVLIYVHALEAVRPAEAGLEERSEQPVLPQNFLVQLVCLALVVATRDGVAISAFNDVSCCDVIGRRGMVAGCGHRNRLVQVSANALVQ